MNGLPRKYERSRVTSANTKPTATCDCFSVMDETATISATAAPMPAPVRKPSRMLSVLTATAKPPIADRRMVPFMDRLVTPARSEMVSPMTANSRGAAATSTPARPMMIVLESMLTSRTAHQALAHAFDHQDEKHQHALQDTRQG